MVIFQLAMFVDQRVIPIGVIKCGWGSPRTSHGGNFPASQASLPELTDHGMFISISWETTPMLKYIQAQLPRTICFHPLRERTPKPWLGKFPSSSRIFSYLHEYLRDSPMMSLGFSKKNGFQARTPKPSNIRYLGLTW